MPDGARSGADAAAGTEEGRRPILPLR
jgi:hypothetical protein